MATAVQSAADLDRAVWQPSINPWLIAISVILPTFMEVLDTTIANVALRHIAGSMAASYSQATWVLTSYLIANAIILPLTAWLGNRFQRKRFLLSCIFLFTVSSLLCGLSVSLPMLLCMRVLQGLGGGALAPISQAILMESFPPKRQGAAQAVFGLGVVVAPVVGPILGGWLTDSYSWRWIFYINVPLGLLAIWAIQQTVEDPPWVRKSDPGPFDALGILALSLWLGCQEVALDKGQEDDWLSSNFIRTMIVLAVVGFVVFLIRELKAEKPMVDLRIFRERNLAVGTVLIFLTCVLIYGIGLLTPQFLQQLMNYTSFWAGVATAPLGLGAAIAMIAVGALVSRIDARWLTTLGFLVFAVGSWMLSRLNLEISALSVFWPEFLAGLSMGFLFVPVNVAATAPLRRDELGTATGCLSLMRNVGGSVGIAMVSTFIARRAQFHQTVLSGDITPSSATVLQNAAGPMKYLFAHAAGPANSVGAALGVLYQLMLQQAALLSFRDNFLGLTAVSLASIVLVFALRKARASKGTSLH